MRLTRKLKTCLVLLLILSFTSLSLAAPGKYAPLKKGELIPWAGRGFDGEAMAQIVAEKELAEQKCELHTMQELDQQKAVFDLKIGQLTASMDYEIETRDATIEALKKDNLKIEAALIQEQKFGWVSPASIGILVGALTIFLVKF